MKKVVPVLLSIGLILCMLIGYLGYVMFKKYSPTKETVVLSEYYGVSEDQAAVFLDNEEQAIQGIWKDGQAYLPVAWVDAQLNEKFYWDTSENLMVYALPDSIEKYDASSVGASGKKLLWVTSEDSYLSQELISMYTNVRFSVFTEDEVRRIYVDRSFEKETWTKLAKKGAVRTKGGIKSPIVTQEPEGALVLVLDSMDRWAKVRTEDGQVGYIENRRLGEKQDITYVSTFTEPVYTNISQDQKICLVWHQVTAPEANGSIAKLLANTKGVNVVSPTWLAVTDNQGSITSLADRSYVDYVHSQGMQVWALVDNLSKDVQSEILLSSTTTREKLIAALMEQVETFALDGINLDFESLKEAAGPHYIQFIRELSVACRQRQVVLSVDNYVPSSYTAFYNRAEQGRVADYVIVMGYDEHFAGGEAGPVASIDYVTNGIMDTLEVVPKEKVINAVPFYTRVWKEGKDGTSSDALGISDSAAWVKKSKVSLHWQESLGLFYGETTDSAGVRKEIWQEDERSLGLKMDVIREQDLAGVACWKLGFEPKSIWNVISWETAGNQ